MFLMVCHVVVHHYSLLLSIGNYHIHSIYLLVDLSQIVLENYGVFRTGPWNVRSSREKLSWVISFQRSAQLVLIKRSNLTFGSLDSNRYLVLWGSLWWHYLFTDVNIRETWEVESILIRVRSLIGEHSSFIGFWFLPIDNSSLDIAWCNRVQIFALSQNPGFSFLHFLQTFQLSFHILGLSSVSHLGVEILDTVSGVWRRLRYLV